MKYICFKGAYKYIIHALHVHGSFMRLSSYYMPVFKEFSQDAVTPAHQYSIRAGIVKQISSGIYSWLPAGTRVISKLCAIVREEMNKAGAIEIIMPVLQPITLWEESGRSNDYGDELIRFTDRGGRDLILGPTHEEIATDIARYAIKSYKDLPLNLYQIQWKFRDEIRPRFGIMRTREFLMKDAYSFDSTQSNAVETYYKMYQAYINTFKRIGFEPIATLAKSGAIGGDMSHEFHIISESGENKIYYDSRILELNSAHDMKKLYARSEDTHSEDLITDAKYITSSNAIEAGHIFYFGTKYSKTMNAMIHNRDSSSSHIFMGSYGIGISRLVGTAIEAFKDDKGIVWPACIAPFKICISNLMVNDEKCKAFSEIVYENLDKSNTIYNDKDDSAGSKLNTAEITGIPIHVIIGTKNAAAGLIEIKYRKSGFSEVIKLEEAINKLQSLQNSTDNWY